MAKKCELTGKNPMKGHNVSHANNKTKRRFLPNLKKVKFTSEILKRSLKITVSNAGVRSVDKKGSFDEFLKTVKNKNLSPRLKKLKKDLLIKSPFLDKVHVIVFLYAALPLKVCCIDSIAKLVCLRYTTLKKVI